MFWRQGITIIALIPCLLGIPSFTVARPLDRELLGEDCYRLLHGDKPIDELLRQACLEKTRKVPVLVITPTRRAERPSRVPAAIGVVAEEQVEERAVTNIADALRDVPGVEVADGGQPGLKRLRIRGEESRRVAILIDGQEFADEREVGTPLLIAPEMVERVEILRGTNSVLHGSRALGGVVNFITKKGGYHPVQATGSMFVDTATKGLRNFASLYGSVGGVDYRLSGMTAHFGNIRSATGEVENTASENDSLSLYLGTEGKNWRLWTTLDNYNASSNVYVDPSVRTAPPFLDFQIDAPKRDRAKGALFAEVDDLTKWFPKAHLDLYFQRSDRIFNTFSDILLDQGGASLVRSSSIFSDSTLNTTGANAQFDLIPALSHSFIVGLDVKQHELNQDRTEVVRMGDAPASLSKTIDFAEQRAIEAYIQDQWSIREPLLVTLGVRGYHVASELERSTRQGLSPGEENDQQVVAAVTLSGSPADHVNLWTGWSQGFAFPTLINLATGAFAGPSYVSPNPELDSETSNSFEVGARYDDPEFSLDAVAFYTSAENYIDHVLCSAVSVPCIEPTDSRSRVYVNVDEADTFGVETSIEYSAHGVTPYLNLAWIRRRFDSNTFGVTYDTGLPPVTSRIGVRFDHELTGKADWWVDAYLRLAASATETSRLGEKSETPGWGTTNFAVGFRGGEKRQYRFSVEFTNLGGKSYRVATDSVPAPGRSALLRLAIDL